MTFLKIFFYNIPKFFFYMIVGGVVMFIFNLLTN